MLASIGPVEFSVSEQLIKTFTDLALSQKAAFAEHKILNRPSLIEFTGLDSSACSMKISLNVDRGNNPLNDIQSLQELLRSHEPAPFTVGGHVMGSGLWVIESLSIAAGIIADNGDVLSADVNLSLKEYNDENA